MASREEEDEESKLPYSDDEEQHQNSYQSSRLNKAANSRTTNTKGTSSAKKGEEQGGSSFEELLNYDYQIFPSRDVDPKRVCEEYAAAGFRIFGGADNDECQMIEFTLQPGDKITAKEGSLVYASENVKMRRTKIAGRIMNVYTHDSLSTCGTLAISPSYPSTIIPLNLFRDFPLGLFVKTGSWLASTGEGATTAEVAVSSIRSYSAWCYGGVPFSIEKLVGKHNSWSFLVGNGLLLSHRLAPGKY
jgi:uncharacterized protein (AIM24 family)